MFIYFCWKIAVWKSTKKISFKYLLEHIQRVLGTHYLTHDYILTKLLTNIHNTLYQPNYVLLTLIISCFFLPRLKPVKTANLIFTPTTYLCLGKGERMQVREVQVFERSRAFLWLKRSRVSIFEQRHHRAKEEENVCQQASLFQVRGHWLWI